MQTIRFHHRRHPDGILHGALAGHPALHLARNKRIHRQQILDVYRAHLMAGQGRHYLAHPLKHAAGVSARFAADVAYRSAGAHRLHDGFRALGDIGLSAALFAANVEVARRDHPRLHIPLRGLEHHRGTVANQGAGDGDDGLGLFRA